MITNITLASSYTLTLAGNAARLTTPSGESVRLRSGEYESTMAILNDADEGLCSEDDLIEHCRAIALDAGIAA